MCQEDQANVFDTFIADLRCAFLAPQVLLLFLFVAKAEYFGGATDSAGKKEKGHLEECRNPKNQDLQSCKAWSSRNWLFFSMTWKFAVRLLEIPIRQPAQ